MKSETYLAELLNSLSSLTASKRRKAIAAIAEQWGVTAGTVYRRLKKTRDCSRRDWSIRCDVGLPRVMTRKKLEYYIKIVMGLKTYDPSKPNKRIPNPNKAMSTERAIEIAEKIGAVPENTFKARTINRWAKRYNLTAKDICDQRAAVKLVSEHPNQVHVVDFSVCEQYYLRDSDGKVALRSWSYKNKPNEAKEKIWTFALVDHFSNVKFIKYFLSPGESSDILLNGLMEAWSKKDDTQFPFHGAPKCVYADRGSAIRSDVVSNLMKALGVEIITHKPGNPRAKGMVEGAFRALQIDFENELRYCPAESLDELNDRAYNWLVHHNWQAKSGEKSPRNSIWQTITQEQLLELPPVDLLRRVAATGEIRRVDRYCTIRFKNEIHGVPTELVGKKVRVWTDIDGGLSVQDMETGTMHPVSEQRTAAFGEYHAFKRSAAEVHQDEALAMAHELKKEITPDVLRRDVPNIHAMPKKGTAVEVDSPITGLMNQAPTYATVYHAKLAIADELRINLGDLPQWMIDHIDNALKSNPVYSLRKDTVHKIAVFIDEFLRKEEAV